MVKFKIMDLLVVVLSNLVSDVFDGVYDDLGLEQCVFEDKEVLIFSMESLSI